MGEAVLFLLACLLGLGLLAALVVVAGLIVGSVKGARAMRRVASEVDAELRRRAVVVR